jgi:hypothetical protein
LKRLIAVGAAALVVAAPAAAPAGAATPQAVRIAQLEKQVKTLTTQVKTLTTRERFDRNEIAANYSGDACQAAVFADLLQSTWAMVDQGAPTAKFLTEPAVGDKDSCKGIGVTRQGLKLPPSISIVTSLIAWIIGS